MWHVVGVIYLDKWKKFATIWNQLEQMQDKMVY